MAGKPTTIAEYIKAAPPEGQAHLRKLRSILRSVAPKAEEAIKWGAPFYIEPRFLFSFNACTAHCNLAPSAEALEAFRKELKEYKTTKSFLQMPYDEPVPAALVRRIAQYQLKRVSQRKDDA